uniref:Uncharacterized protein n=1 Tax=Anguilla anguilla TaxID=7936 RepID=A0A0E9QKE2_ANGAN
MCNQQPLTQTAVRLSEAHNSVFLPAYPGTHTPLLSLHRPTAVLVSLVV